MPNKIYISSSTDPYENLAFEELLCRRFDGTFCCFLWQNDQTVVIGRNQNAYRECRVNALLDDGGRLARRTTGGGAVWHDLGNLNFSFILREGSAPAYAIIISALKRLGVNAELSGRNDFCLPDGRKFSGSAFRHSGKVFLHHGTLLLSSELEKMERYLSPSFEKIQAKGIKSVRSRVVDLAEVNRQITVETMKAAIVDSVSHSCDGVTVEDAFSDAMSAGIAALLASRDWIFGNDPEASITLRRRFPWGEIELLIRAEKGAIASVRAYTDSLDENLSAALESALAGCGFAAADMADAVSAIPKSAALDISRWLSQAVV